MKINLNAAFLFRVFVILIPVSLSLEYLFDMLYIGYVDEVFVVLLICYIATKRNISSSDRKIIILLVVFTAIGILSNLFSNLISVLHAILIDAFLQWKIFIAFIGCKILAQKDYRRQMILPLTKLSKGLLVILYETPSSLRTHFTTGFVCLQSP
jgi:hypothetical protein